MCAAAVIDLGHALQDLGLFFMILSPLAQFIRDIRLMFEAAATGVSRREGEWTDTHAEFFYQLYVQTEAERYKAIRDSEQRRMRRVV